MTRRLLLTTLASTVLVLVAFLVPLWVLVGRAAADRATDEAVLEAQPLLTTLVLTPTDGQAAVVTAYAATAPRPTSLVGADGKVSGSPFDPTDPTVAATVSDAAAGSPGRVDTEAGRELLLPVSGSDQTSGTGPVLRVLVTADDLESGVARARTVLVLLCVLLLGLAVLVAWYLARSLLAPLRQLEAGAARLAAGDLSTRVDVTEPPEVAQVADQLNRLSGRLSGLLASEREQVADLAHRLRTPTTVLRLDAEALSDPDERSRLTDDVDRLERVVDTVIHEARRPMREDAGATCDVAAVVAERARFWSVLAEEQQRAMSTSGRRGPVWVRGSQRDLSDAVDSLLENVFAHTPDGTAFSVEVVDSNASSTVDVVVRDSGPGLPPDVDTERLLDRGVSGAGSTGLGLDVARRTAEASGGGLELGTAPGGGLLVRLRLGRAPRP